MQESHPPEDPSLASVRAAAPKRAGGKIAYIKRGLFSYSNVRTGEQLRRAFPELEVEEVDVYKDLLRRRPLMLAINMACVVRRYWRDLLTGRQTLRRCFYRTPYIFRKIRQLIRARLEPRKAEFLFTFQTQSLYDGSVPGVPHFVYTDHAHLTNLAYPGFDRRLLFSRGWIDVEQEIYRNATHVFVMSEHVRRTLIDHYACDGSRVSPAYAGSNVDPSPVSLRNADYSNKTVLFVGIDWERKGGPTLVKAFEAALARHPSARLVIVGCAPSVRHPQITVLGKVSREEVKEQLVQASIFCLPTRVEPFGIAVVEAFLHKLPVIASNIGAMPGVVREGESGLLVPPDDPKALANALIELLGDPEKCRRFGERGFELMQENYSWDAAGERMGKTIRKVLSLEAAALPVQPADDSSSSEWRRPAATPHVPSMESPSSVQPAGQPI